MNFRYAARKMNFNEARIHNICRKKGDIRETLGTGTAAKLKMCRNLLRPKTLNV